MEFSILQKEIYKLLKLYDPFFSYLPSKDENDKELDFNNIYTVYKFTNIADEGYKKEVNLEIQIISKLENEASVLKQAVDIDKVINKTYLEPCNCRIVRENSYFIPINDFEDKKHYTTLNYIINYY